MQRIAPIGLLFIMIVLTLSGGGAPLLSDPDTAWHLAAGDLIRQLHHVPLHDPWSFTAAGERWYNLSWLFDVGFSRLFALAGFPGIVAFTLLLFTVSLCTMLHHCLVRGAGPFALFLVLIPSILALYPCLLARPNLCSYALTLGFYILLERYRAERRFAFLLPLPALMAVWVNLHGGFLLAFPLLLLHYVDARREKDRTAARDLLVITGLCLAATLINPYGYGLYYAAYRTLTGSFDQQHITEWKPVQIGLQYPGMTLMLLALLFLGLNFDKAIPWRDRALTLVMFLLAMSSARHMGTAVLLMLPTISLRTTHLLQSGALGEKAKGREATVAADMQKPEMRMMGIVLCGLAILLIFLPFLDDRMSIGPKLGFPVKNYPEKEAAFIEAHYPDVRFYNDYNIGGYLDYLWRGRVKVFVDGRASSLYSDDMLNDYVTFADSHGFGGHAEMIALHYHLGGLVIPNDSKESGDWHWNPAWKAVYHGDVATVYIKNDKKKN